MSTPTEPAPGVPVTQKREFWALMGYAIALGVFGAFAGLVFVGAIAFAGKWYADSDPGWFGGHWWWVAVTAAAGVVVGLLRRLMRLPEQIPGLFADLKSEHVDTGLVPGIGSACFLVSGYLAYVEVCGGLACRRRRSLEWRIAAVNLAGCVAFGISAVASYVVPATGDVVDLAAANAFTALGTPCFLVGAVLLLPESATAVSS